MATKAQDRGGYDPATNPSGASEEQLRKGEMTGKVRGRDVDPTFHTYEFTDPVTGEPVETHQAVHDVPVGVNADGSLETAKATDDYAKPAEGADTKQSQGANQGESGERERKK
jgi:hypothetical protein